MPHLLRPRAPSVICTKWKGKAAAAPPPPLPPPVTLARHSSPDNTPENHDCTAHHNENSATTRSSRSNIPSPHISITPSHVPCRLSPCPQLALPHTPTVSHVGVSPLALPCSALPCSALQYLCLSRLQPLGSQTPRHSLMQTAIHHGHCPRWHTPVRQPGTRHRDTPPTTTATDTK